LTQSASNAAIGDHVGNSHMAGDHKIEMYNFSSCVMLSKPILALKFTQMKKLVDAPITLFPAENFVDNTVTLVP